ncbi:hypothetical protein JG688_00007992 [Phytophthora aleatoria]|uniref:Uncharacterized protein n=1 Tax=Phytophthora aleatoria TaxID=2496075 RepID=A0A8J5J590_9STRA|nr:hypothetical protein JG688_00007992 [Phytophthora aleatoria]
MHLNNRVLVKILDQASRSSIRSHQRPHSIKVHLTLKLCQYRRKAANTSMASTRSPSKFEFHRQITQSDDPQLGRGVGLVYLGLGLQDGEGQGPQQQWQRAIITPPTRVRSPTHVRRCRPVNNRVTEHSNDCQLSSLQPPAFLVPLPSPARQIEQEHTETIQTCTATSPSFSDWNQASLCTKRPSKAPPRNKHNSVVQAPLPFGEPTD